MEEKFQLAKIARMYYEDGLTLADIGSRIHVSRYTVSRMLKQAKEIGVVEILIHDQWQQSESLEFHLKESFNLEHVVVMVRGDRTDQELYKGLGFLGGQYLSQVLEPGSVLGISWGRTMNSLVEQFQPSGKKDLRVVQMMGFAGVDNLNIDGPDIARRLAEKLNCPYQFLPAPLVVESPELKADLINQGKIREVLSMADSSGIKVFSVGCLSQADHSIWTGYMDSADFQVLMDAGVVGHISGHFFDEQGEIVDVRISRTIIGTDLEAISQTPLSICVAGGGSKWNAILGGLRGGFFNVLVTDDLSAREILAS